MSYNTFDDINLVWDRSNINKVAYALFCNDRMDQINSILDSVIRNKQDRRFYENTLILEHIIHHAILKENIDLVKIVLACLIFCDEGQVKKYSGLGNDNMHPQIEAFFKDFSTPGSVARAEVEYMVELLKEGVVPSKLIEMTKGSASTAFKILTAKEETLLIPDVAAIVATYLDPLFSKDLAQPGANKSSTETRTAKKTSTAVEVIADPSMSSTAHQRRLEEQSKLSSTSHQAQSSSNGEGSVRPKLSSKQQEATSPMSRSDQTIEKIVEIPKERESYCTWANKMVSTTLSSWWKGR
jgi:hypothetical protein